MVKIEESEEEKEWREHREHMIKSLRSVLVLGGIAIISTSIGIFPSLIYDTSFYMLIPLIILVIGIIPIYIMLVMKHKMYVEDLEGGYKKWKQ